MKKLLFTFLLLSIALIGKTQNINISVADNETYEISYHCADFIVADTALQYEDGQKQFSYLKFADGTDYDYITDDDSPQIPFVSLNLRLPDDAEEAYIEIDAPEWTKINLPLLYMPSQLYTRDEQPRKFVYQESRSNRSTESSSALECGSVSPVYTMAGCKGVTVNLYPFDYRFNYSDNGRLTSTISYLADARIRVSYNTSASSDNNPDRETQSLYSLHESADQMAVWAFDNYKYIQTRSVTSTSYRYLIITENKYISSLTPFVNYKDSLGFTVQVVSTTSIGETADSIRNYLVWYYRQHSDLRYVLLVGDIGHIPFSSGSNGSTSNPPTDVYYSCLDYYDISHQTDLHPDVYVGRWLVDNVSNVLSIRNKSISSEKNLYSASSSNKQVGLFSGCGNYENMFYNSLNGLKNDIFLPYLYSHCLVDGRWDYSIVHDALKNSINGNLHYTWFLIYNGHSCNYGFGNPYCVYSYTINYQINNSAFPFQPFAFTTGCQSANLYEPDAYQFVLSWLGETDGNGGISLLAGTVDVLTAPANKYLEYLFKPLKSNSHPNMSIGSLCANGGSNYYHADKVTYRKNQYRKMVFFGDPSLMIQGNSISNPSYTKKRPEDDAFGTLFDIQKISQKNIASIDLYSTTGCLLKRYSNCTDFVPADLERGVYLISVTTEEGTNTYKYILQ